MSAGESKRRGWRFTASRFASEFQLFACSEWPMYVHICALADLIQAHGSSLPCAFGIEDVVELAAAGRYVREAPALVLGKLEPHAEIYRQFIASHQQDTPAVHLVTLRDASVLNQGAV